MYVDGSSSSKTLSGTFVEGESYKFMASKGDEKFLVIDYSATYPNVSMKYDSSKSFESFKHIAVIAYDENNNIISVTYK